MTTTDNSVQQELAIIDTAFQRLLTHRQFVLGPEVDELERWMADWLGTQHAVGCNSGFGAHLLSVLALGIDAGSKVVVPAFAPPDHVGTILRRNAIPVVVDVVPGGFHLDPALVADHMDGASAVEVHHLFGDVADVRAIMAVAGDIPVIEVMTYSFGARSGARRAGTFGTLVTSCLREETTIGAYGDAGMIWTNDSGLDAKIRSIRAEKGWTEVHHGITSGNFHMDSVQAGILLGKLELWRAQADVRNRQAAVLSLAIQQRGLDEVRVFPHYQHNASRFVLVAQRRDDLVVYLQEHGVRATPWWPIPIHLQPGFARLGYQQGDFPEAERLSQSSLHLELPSTVDQLEPLVDHLVGFYRA